ncbi:hypothetical protein AYO42_05720 [Rhizomicrobium sp. SCGC AG-212-E05]|nr:hypothetical protein AYO42_05720 [Rhizomicrobium sp. SCGC AG-212-E05]
MPDTRPTQQAPTEQAIETFAAICRSEEVVDSRRDPAWVSQSFAGDNCQAPRPPRVIDGPKASREEIVAGMEAAKIYAAAADRFQKCVSDFVAARKATKPLTPSQAIIQNYRITVSQKTKEMVAAQTRVAIVAFNSYGSDCPM